MDFTEHKIQQSILLYFNNTYCLKHHSPRSLILAIPNGGQRSQQQAAQSKSLGEYPGASDLLILHNSHCYFVEIKTEKGKQSPSQLAFQQHIESTHHTYQVIRSLDEFKLWLASLNP